ncbi:MAG: DUF885 family protein [Bacilli bacterium]|nr:DUF885 family protein [Bacilli bacterium]
MMKNLMKKSKMFLMVALLLVSGILLVGCTGPITEETLQTLPFENLTVDYDGEQHSILVPEKYTRKGVEVTYKNNNKILPGEYEVKATLKYEDFEVVRTAILTIVGYDSVLTAEAEQNFYINEKVELEYSLDNEKQKVEITDKDGNIVDPSKYTKPGTYEVVLFAPKVGLYADSNKVNVTINIKKSFYGVVFTSKEVVYDGTEHKVELAESLPDGYTVKYSGNTGTEVGKYQAKAEILDASGKVVETHQAVLNIEYPENEDFAAYLDEFFVTYLEDDQLSVNIFCENPANFGLEHYDAEWYAYESFGEAEIKEDMELFNELLDELHVYKDAKLNEQQEIAYDTIEAFLQSYLDMYSIEDSSFMNITYVDQFGGYVADFGTYMESYSLRSEQEVKDIVSYIKSTKEAFPSYLDFVQDKLDKGYGLSDYTITEMRGYLSDVLKDKDNYYLVDVISQKIDKLSFLDDAAKADYKAQVAKEMKDSFMVGVKALYDGLEKFLGKVAKEDEGYWAKYEKGKELYVLTLKDLLGYQDLNVEEYIKEVDRALTSAVSKVVSAQNAIVSATGISTWEQLEAILAKNSILEGTPEEMVEYLKVFAKTIVPDLESEPNIVIKEMDEASAKVSNAVAYYMKSALDNTGSEFITLNPVKLNDSTNNDVIGTLAHEGYPGHLYAYVYAKELDLSNLLTIMTSTAHGEGWATYVELALYQYAKEQSDNTIFDLVMDYYYANQLSGFLLETRLDAGVHYEGWGTEDIAKYMSKVGYSSDGAEDIYNLLIEMPTQYASYGYGKLVFYNLHEEAKTILGGYYDEVEFNDMLLSNGWVNLQQLEKQYEEYMADKCYECGIEYK